MSILDYAAIAMIFFGATWLAGFLGVRSCWKLIRTEVSQFFSSFGGDPECPSKL